VARKEKQPHGGSLLVAEKGDPGGPGRPPLLLSTIVAELRSQGYERATANQVPVILADANPIEVIRYNLQGRITSPRDFGEKTKA